MNQVLRVLRHLVRNYGLVALWTAFGIGALTLLAKSAQNSAQFGRLQPWILLINVIGVGVLTVLLARKLFQLARDLRDHVPGSRLTARTVTIFGALVIAPLIIVYLFSLEFLNHGIDSWFRVEVKQGLNDALVLSRATLDLRMREHGVRTEEFARLLRNAPEESLSFLVDSERRSSGAEEVVVFGPHERVIVASSAATADLLPERPSVELVRQVSEGRPFVSLEPLADGGYVIRTAAPVDETVTGSGRRYVLAVYQVPRQIAALSEAVQHAYSQYGELAAVREPVKNSFRLTLTLVLLLSMLTAIYGAIFSAQRLVRPVQDLIAGTRAVGKGDFGTRLPLPSRDEMGSLVQSFNDMTKRLRRAREEATRSQQAVERERARLAVILARLSTGVLVIDRLLQLRIANEAANAILGVDFTAAIGGQLTDLAGQSPRFDQFVRALTTRFSAGRDEWREQVDLVGDAGPRVLMCACTPLGAPANDSDEPGFVIVFDDITAFLRAQRDAAWGEVARRLAHEIKNPLTPIQLSAERMRRRFHTSANRDDAEVVERATQTIVNQVEAMKQMVNAFSEYARAPDMKVARFALNALVTEVAELYRAQDPAVDLKLDLDAELTEVEADRGRIRQILNNLTTNALEALEGTAGARIEIATRLESVAEAGYAVLTVTDNGPGFQRGMVANVFEPYVTSKPRGTGLGLAIVKKIVEEHGGRIEADNQPAGGARVKIVLPVKDSSRSSLMRDRRAEVKRERA
jgi:nitrogen fixation/metabolism regulation signal transduction histidine kinase